MPRTPRTEHERRRDAARRIELRTARAQARHVVPVSERRDDDWIVDHVAIDLALRGWAKHAAALSVTELRAAVVEGMRREYGTPVLADLLLLHEREIDRLRAQIREQERTAVPA